MVSNPHASENKAMEGAAPGIAAAHGATPEETARRRRAWTASLALFGLGSLVLLWAFRNEVLTAVTLWSNSSTYGYGFFVLPITAFLMFRQREELARLTPRAAPWALIPAAGLIVVWMVADLANVMVVQQLAFVGLWQTLFLIVMGWRVTWAVLFPLGYLILAVPLGSEIIPQLQTITAQFVVHLLRLTGMPVFLDGYYIQIPSGSFLVAEACSGLNFLIVCIALGLLIAQLFFQTWQKRLLFVALSVIVPVVANGLRAYGIIMLAHLSDYRLAADVDHIVYGFIFLSFVILVLIGIAMLMHERVPPVATASGAPPADAPAPARHSQNRRFAGQAVCALLALAVVLLGQGWSTAAKAPPAGPLAAQVEGPEPSSGWSPVAGKTPAWTARFAAPDSILTRHYSEGSVEVDLQAAYYAYQRQGAEALNEMNTQLAGGQSTWRQVDQRSFTADLGDRRLPLIEMVLKDRDEARLVWYWYSIGGDPTNSRVVGKLLETRNLLLGQDRSAFVIALSTAIAEDRTQAATVLEDFLKASLDRAGALVQVND